MLMIPIKVQKLTFMTFPPVKFLPIFELYSFPTKDLPYISDINNEQFKQKIINPKPKLNMNIIFNFNWKLSSIFTLYLCFSKSKLTKDATVFILYKISSAIPPAF